MRLNKKANMTYHQPVTPFLRVLVQQVLLLMLSLLLILSSGSFSLAQDRTQSKLVRSYEDLVSAIKEEAEKDFQTNPACDFDKTKDYYKSELDTYLKGDSSRLRKLRDFYKDTCKKKQESKKWDIFSNVKDNTAFGIIIGGIVVALIGALIRDPIVKFAKFLQDKLGTWAYKQLSGQPWFWGWGLNKYRQKLKEKNQTWRNPFGQNLSLNRAEVYVPLKVAAASQGGHPVDADWAISDQRRLMIIGSPGAGKSMLMSNIALRYADGKLRVPGDPLLILVELNGLSQALQNVPGPESISKIEEYLIHVLHEHDFPNAGRLLRQRLEAKPHQPTALLLFDGLDEVSTNERNLLTQYLQRFLDHYREPRVVITCRTQVYQHAGFPFKQYVDQTLEVDEFSDQQIRRFLQPWRKVMTGKSIEKLIEELRDRPRIQELARNPMLLTIIASLYAGDDFFELPHSRAAFYREATHVLLKKWDQRKGLTRYEETDKRSLLREIALEIQTTAHERGERRNIDYEKKLFPLVREWLPNLGLNEGDAKPILDDIRFRSGLLMELENGEIYRFTHLTLQEFFVAENLLKQEHGIQKLIHHFQADPDGWCEVIKLSCGLAIKDQSKTLIEQVYACNPLTAFESLVDVREIDPDLENKIIEEFKGKLGDPNNSLPNLEAAFGLVAANSQKIRGNQILDFLIDTAKSQDINKKHAAIRALSHSNLPKASEILSKYYADSPILRDAMVEMGDLAVPHLLKHICQGSLFAIDDLLRIGTPDAALALANCLWNSPSPTSALRAAWCLAMLLPIPEIADALGSMDLSSEKSAPERWKFVWLPFQNLDDQDSHLSVIAAQIIHLLETSDFNGFDPPRMAQSTKEKGALLDPRLIIPLCTISDKLKPDIRQISTRDWSSHAEILLKSDGNQATRKPLSSTQERQILVLGRRSLSRKIRESTWYQLLATQAPILQLDLVNRLIQSNLRPPTERDWRQLFNVKQYRFEHSWQFHGVVSISFLLSCLALLCWSLLLEQSFRLNQSFGWLSCLGLTIIPISWIWLLADGWPISPVRFWQIGIGGGFTFFTDLLRIQQQRIIWPGAILMRQCLANHRLFVWAMGLATLGAVVVALFPGNWFGFGLVIFAISLICLSVGASFGTGIFTILQRGWAGRLLFTIAIGLGTISTVLFLPRIPQGLGWAGLVVLLSGVGVAAGATAPNHQSRWLALPSYPLFCGFPAVLMGLIYPLLINSHMTISKLSLILVIYGLLIGIAILFWKFGKFREYHASNPLRDLPELEQYNPYRRHRVG
jgi:hypothetical protein